MEVQSTFNFKYPSSECFAALHSYVLGNLALSYRIGYGLLKMPMGKVNIRPIEIHERATFIKAKIQITAYYVVPYTFGPVINIYCVTSGRNICSVEMSAEAKVYDGSFLNFTTDLIRRFYPKVVLKAFPRVYFGTTVVYDGKTFAEDQYSTDANIRALKCVFQQTADVLETYLKQKLG